MLSSYKRVNNNEGQVLLIVVLVLSIVLGLSLGITSRVTTSISRVSTLDSFQKVTAAAEGGIEIELNKSDAEILGTTTRTHTFSSSNTQSEITVSLIPTSAISFENFTVGETLNINLVDFTSLPTDPNTRLVRMPSNIPEEVCFNFQVEPSGAPYTLQIVSSNPNANLNFVNTATGDAVYNNLISGNYVLSNYVYTGSSWDGGNPTLRSGQLCSFLGNLRLGCRANNNTCSDSSSTDFPVMVRLKPINQELTKITFVVVSVNGSTLGASTNLINQIPQAIKINSKGKFISGGDGTEREIEAIKFLDTPASFFDFGTYLDN